MGVKFQYRLVGAGWAEARVSGSVVDATFRASYLSDALTSLIDAVNLVLAGAVESRCTRVLEPGEYRWILGRQGLAGQLRVLQFSDAEARQADDRGVLVVHVELPLREIAVAIADGAQEALDEYGESVYGERWGHPFPLAGLRQLRSRLAGEHPFET
jgi:hypothetical protein